MKKELSNWPYKLIMLLGVVVIITGLVACEKVESVWQETSVLIIIIGGFFLLLFGKHLEKEQRIIYLLENYLSSINKSLSKSKNENEKTCDCCGKKISAYPCPYCGDPGAVIYNNIVR